MSPQAAPDPRLGSTGLLEYVRSIEAVLDALPEPPVLVGHSMGGLIAQVVATRRAVHSLVLLAPAAPAGIWALTPSVVRSFWSAQTRWGFWRHPFRQTFSEASYSMLHLMPPAEQKRIFDALVFESGRAAFEIGYWPLDRSGASRVDAGRISCPVLVVSGRHDRITPAHIVRKVAAKYGSQAEYWELPEHAHWLIGEPGWEEVASRVVEWLPS